MKLFGSKKDKAEKGADYAALPDAVQALMASMSNHDGQSANITPVADAIGKKNREKEAARRKATEEAIKKAKPGDIIEGEGVYLGQYAPVDHDGVSLGKIFNVFAAPADLEYGGERTNLGYNETVAYLSSLRQWHGHDGASYNDDAEIFKALGNGSYEGEWIIPPRDILRGKRYDGHSAGTDTLWHNHEAGRLKDNFCAALSGSDLHPAQYWSSTEANSNRSTIWSTSFLPAFPGAEGRHDKHANIGLSCRPVRLVEVKP